MWVGRGGEWWGGDREEMVEGTGRRVEEGKEEEGRRSGGKWGRQGKEVEGNGEDRIRMGGEWDGNW